MNATLTLDRRGFGSPATKRGYDTSSTFRAVREAKALEAKRLDYSLGHRISGANFRTTPRLPPISRRQPYVAPDRGILRTACCDTVRRSRSPGSNQATSVALRIDGTEV